VPNRVLCRQAPIFLYDYTDIARQSLVHTFGDAARLLAAAYSGAQAPITSPSQRYAQPKPNQNPDWVGAAARGGLLLHQKLAQADQ
jgi:hypothetical protein